MILGAVFLVLILARRMIFPMLGISSYRFSVLIEAGVAFAQLSIPVIFLIPRFLSGITSSESALILACLSVIIGFLITLAGVVYEIRWNLLKS